MNEQTEAEAEAAGPLVAVANVQALRALHAAPRAKWSLAHSSATPPSSSSLTSTAMTNPDSEAFVPYWNTDEGDGRYTPIALASRLRRQRARQHRGFEAPRDR